MAKPNMKQLMDAGVDSTTASELLYGVVGANKDTRDWDAIMASGDPIAAARAATAAMYSDGEATSETIQRATDNLELAGTSKETEYSIFGSGSGKPDIVKTDSGYAIVAGNGLALRAGYPTLAAAQKAGVNFGIGSSDTSSFSANTGTSLSSEEEAELASTKINDGVGSVSNQNLSEYEQAVKELADLNFLSMTTGVASSKLNAAYEKLGIDSSDNYAFMEANDLLREYGYTPGNNNSGFYANATLGGAMDEGINAYLQAKDAAYEMGYLDSTTENLEKYAGKIDPNTGQEYKFMVNDNVANAALIEEVLGGSGSTNASFPSRVEGWDVEAKRNETYDDQESRINQYYGSGGNNPQIYNALQWIEIEKKKKDKIGSSGSSGTTATITGGGTTTTGGTTTGGDTGTDTYTGPEFVSTPNIGTITPVYGQDQTGLTEVDIPTYEAGLGLQKTQFDNRSTEQAKLYQPQTLAEQEAAGTAPTFQNVLYRNRFGMSMYIQHINGVPSQPIPQGYFPVESFTTQDQTQGGSAAQAQNQGGIIQGFSNGATVNPALNYKPGGTVVEENGVYRIKYPDGTYSQNYDTALNARAANQQGATNLGLPDYNTYLTNLGVDRNLPGYDETAYQSAYNTYITDPATVEQIKADKAAEDAKAAQPDPINAEVGGDQPTGETTVTPEQLAQTQANLNAQAFTAPGGAVAASPVSYIDPNATGTVIESTAGQALGTAPMVQEEQVAQIGSATTADTPAKTAAGQVTANQAYDEVAAATEGMSAVTMDGPTKTIDAAQQTGTSVSTLDAATGESVDVTGAPTRTEQTGEMIDGSAVDQAQVASAFGTGEVQAASVQGELASLMQQFEGGETPAWAAGSMRAASAMLAARGLSASSMAGQAVIQAAMESALPIAQIDASNKQQMSLFKAEQRAKFLQMDFDQEFQAKVMNAAKVSEIANMNFTAQQQIALENSKAANTMALQNLTNEQALIMAEAAALSQMDASNLSNRQQAAIQNAQNFLQIDMANLSNEQQTATFKQQSLINSILSDQAAANAAQQFNATSQNQTDQFFANLSASVNQFNAAQINAMKQFNADEVNGLLEFNAALQNQREMFNAQNYLVVAQANAQWRQNLATVNTAAANQSNMEYAKNVNNITQAALDEIWMRERDLLSMAFQSSENTLNRNNSVVLQKLAADASIDSAKLQADIEAESGASTLLSTVFMKAVGLI